MDDLENQGLYSSAPAFYDFLQNRVLVQFRSKNDETKPEFELMLSKKQTYDVVSRAAQVEIVLISRWLLELENT